MFQDYEHLTCPVYSFSIDILKGHPKKSDKRIKETVLYVIELFFEDVENVAIYVCDSLDERQIARSRKFDMWFNTYNNNEIIKENCIGSIDGDITYSSLIIHKRNYQLECITKAFKDLNEYDY